MIILASWAGSPLRGSDVGYQHASSPSENALNRAQLYILGPGDVVVINGLNAEDLVGKPMRIDAKGELTLPLIGTVHAGGLTIPQLETLLNSRLSVFVKHPQLIVSVSEYQSQPVSVVGAVNNPGIHQIQGRKTIVEMLSLAGGPRVDAGSAVTLTRSLDQGRLPLPNEHLDPSGHYSTAEISLRDITSGARPGENIFVMPHDVLAVSRASMIYVIGEVNKAGGFPIGDENAVTVVQALSMAQGCEHTADMRHARIIRNSQIPNKREERVCDLQKILNGKSPDITLQADDILYVPGSTGKKIALKALETAITTGSGIAIWGIR
ncbi:MAG TPA: polysaccharide biosynthesis/export family protein [Bryobacteraceae bacterium]|nr:polysaccharide biosynthesis/export family protein [Bryobacteraceae bacterium]